MEEMNLAHAAVVRNINDAVYLNYDLVVKIQSFVSLAFIARLSRIKSAY